jgi:hypothetical protein
VTKREEGRTAGREAPPSEIEGWQPPAAGGWASPSLDEVEIRDERRTAQDVVRRLEGKRFVIDPDFGADQAWDARRQSRLLESVLLRIPLPPFYVAEDDAGRLLVTDGRQRLTTFVRFFAGELALDLPDRPELHGKRFDDLEARLQNRLEDCPLAYYIIDHQVPERARLDVLERVNGGEVLSRQQLRNALHVGPATGFLREQAATPRFREATGGGLDASRMLDRELVNRFCAFALLPIDAYDGDMDGWLGRGLEAVAALDDAQRADLGRRFQRGLRNAQAAFGEEPFRRLGKGAKPAGPLNAALFDVLCTGLSVREEAAVDGGAAKLRAGLEGAMGDPRFAKAVTAGTDSQEAVRARFEIAGALIREALDAP